MAAPEFAPREEQKLPLYLQKRYFPVRIGQIFNERYRVLAKLGFGAYSTVWLARDERAKAYVSLKLCIQDSDNKSPIMNEVNMLRHLEQCHRGHRGSAYARLANEIFEVDGPCGRHYCIVLNPEGCSLWNLQAMFPEGKLPKEIVRDVVQRLLGCANWLFCDCDVIHTEITAQNVLMQTSDDATFRRIEEEETENPSIPVADNGYLVYPSRGKPTSLFELSGEPVLTDFGSSRSANTTNDDWWMPDTHRAPEVLLGLPWDAQVDVWSIGIMALELLEGRNVFNPIDLTNKQYVLPLALSQYISYMGLPPLWMIERSKNAVMKTFFDEKGKWISEPPIPTASLEDFVTSIPPGEEKAKVLRFVKKILVWDPAERAQSAELFSDEWLIP